MSTEVVRRPKSGRALATWRRTRSVKLALAGCSYDDIAEEVGYANRGTAWRVVNEALKGELVDGVHEYRRLESARLDALQGAHWAAAVSGVDIKAAELVLKISTQRSRLLGLDRVTSEVEQTPSRMIVVGASGDYVGDLQKIVEGG